MDEVSEFATKKKDLGKEMGEREKDCRENKSSFPQGIDWHLHRAGFKHKSNFNLKQSGAF